MTPRNLKLPGNRRRPVGRPTLAHWVVGFVIVALYAVLVSTLR